MELEKLTEVLRLHKAWVNDEPGGVKADLRGANLSRADLSGANLYGADLRGANLYSANLYGANLRGANLYGTDLYGANLRGADLFEADLRGANLYGADLYGANLYGADLSGANLYSANLYGADLSGANLYSANLYEADLRGANLYGTDLYGANLRGANLYGAKDTETAQAYTTIVPDGYVIGWKKCKGEILVKLAIPSDAKRSNATGRKCRAEYADVIEVIGGEIGVSKYDGTTEYKVGTRVVCDKWDDDRWNECSGGIHFFITRYEAEQYS